MNLEQSSAVSVYFSQLQLSVGQQKIRLQAAK